MAQNGRKSVPAYQKIQDTIRRRIGSGELKAGSAVDSERELAKIHQVSLMTARHALASLEREGLVERRRGVGTFVSTPRIQINKLMSTTEQLAGRGLTAKSRVLLARIVYDEQEIEAKLALPLGSGVIKLVRLRHAAEEPFSLETCYLSAADFPELLTAPLSRESLFQILERKYDVTLGHADEEIDALAADAKTCELLAIPRRSPVLRIRQLIYSTQKRPLMYVLGFYRSDRHKLVIRRFRENA
ncbi:GntR family transcriptional regulator [Granulicella sp. dw_53]|uniref:GntR family transcriptional regulator n=1 Tax=Granulicella sp. dw_53 TaxID=2719792 RepID=UPI001BD63824|nr:GntR family transcriptional regulator [Granulicella sp. dw_53]